MLEFPCGSLIILLVLKEKNTIHYRKRIATKRVVDVYNIEYLSISRISGNKF